MTAHDPQPHPIGEALFRLVLEELPAVIWATDRECRFTASLGAGLACFESAARSGRGNEPVRVFSTQTIRGRLPLPPIVAPYGASRFRMSRSGPATSTKCESIR